MKLCHVAVSGDIFVSSDTAKPDSTKHGAYHNAIEFKDVLNQRCWCINCNGLCCDLLDLNYTQPGISLDLHNAYCFGPA
jgi:hypothetical protein